MLRKKVAQHLHMCYEITMLSRQCVRPDAHINGGATSTFFTVIDKLIFLQCTALHVLKSDMQVKMETTYEKAELSQRSTISHWSKTTVTVMEMILSMCSSQKTKSNW